MDFHLMGRVDETIRKDVSNFFGSLNESPSSRILLKYDGPDNLEGPGPTSFPKCWSSWLPKAHFYELN